MNETGQLLERVGERFPFPEDSLDRLDRRRDRKRRNERIATAAVALIVATAGIGIAAKAFVRSANPKPANGITRENVSDLSVAWTGQTQSADGGPKPVVHDGIVYGASDRLYAFPASCQTSTSTCRPLWTSVQAQYRAWGWPPAFDGDRLFMVADSSGVIQTKLTTPSDGNYRPGQLFAYPTACGSHGATCSPLWSATIDDFIERRAVVADGKVFVASSTGRIYAFDEACGDDGSTCRPAWEVDVGAAALYGMPLSVSSGIIYAVAGGRLFAISAACLTPTCTPLWSSTRLAAKDYFADAAVVGRGAFVSGVNALAAFPTACTPDCTPTWTSSALDTGSPTVSPQAGLVLVTMAGLHPRDGEDLLAFPIDCTDPCRPLWTASGVAYGANAPVVADGRVFVSGLRGLLAFRVDCADGGEICEPDLVGPAASIHQILKGTGGVCGQRQCPPRAGQVVVKSGLAFLAPENGHAIYAFATDCGSGGATCDPVWTGTTHGLIRGPLAVTDAAVFVGTGDGKIVAFGLPQPATTRTVVPLAVGIVALFVIGAVVVFVRRRISAGL